MQYLVTLPLMPGYLFFSSVELKKQKFNFHEKNEIIEFTILEHGNK